jgi:UrcA family protein
MNRNITMIRTLRLAVLASVASLAAGAVLAQQASEITVEASRAEKTTVGRSATGAQVEVVSLVRRVNYADLDLASHAGATALEQRIKDSAKAACKQLDGLYPLEPPGGPECVKAATDAAMKQAKSAIEAAGKTKTQ